MFCFYSGYWELQYNFMLSQTVLTALLLCDRSVLFKRQNNVSAFYQHFSYLFQCHCHKLFNCSKRSKHGENGVLPLTIKFSKKKVNSISSEKLNQKSQKENMLHCFHRNRN